LLPLGAGHAAIREWELDVFEDAEVADQVEALKDEPDFAIPDARTLGWRQIRDRAIVQQVGALRRRIEQPKDR
jgi:hypothetical protein